MPAVAWAMPQGGQVAAGQAGIAQSGNAMTITQSTQSAIINWQSFAVLSNETVTFDQPNASAVVLNRVLGSDASQIYGQIHANGQVFLVNPYGIYFAPGAEVSVGGLVASTLDISNANFSAGKYDFSGVSTASVVNDGSISTSHGGTVAFIAPVVDNEGHISTPDGTTALGAGSAVDMTMQGNSLLTFQVSAAAVNAQVRNGGAIIANNGAVLMSAQAKDAVLQTVVNNTGVVDAEGVVDHGGVISLLGGDSGTVQDSGTLNASSTSAKGGTVTVTGDAVQINRGASISATGATGGGTLNIGGGFEGRGNIAEATTTTVAEGAVLDASATQNGAGGTVVVRSNVTNIASQTHVHGTLEAHGGAAGGDGGMIETSGATLDTSGIAVNATALKGKAGQWLLDPTMVEITSNTAPSGTTSSGTSPVVISGTNTSYVAPSTIETALDAGTSVTVETSGLANSGAFDVWVVSPIIKNAGGAATLTLQAANSVYVGAPITSTSGALTVNLFAGNNGGTLTGTGTVLLAANITTDGGSVNFGTDASCVTSRTCGNSSDTAALTGGDVYVDSQLQQNGGGSSTPQLVTVDTTSATGNGGSVSIYGQTVIANPSGFTINSAHTGSTGTDGNVLFAGTVDSGNTFQYVTAHGYVNWEVAYQDALSGPGGNTGDTYLATPNTSVLNAVASFTANYNQAWLGGERLMAPTVNGSPTTATNQNALDNTWYWIDGPLGLVVNPSSPTGYGTAFFTQNGSTTSNGNGGTALPGYYANWNPATPEPNDSGGHNLTPAGAGEWVMQFVGSAGEWNDLNPYNNSLPYVTETNLSASPLTVNSGQGTITLNAGVGTNSPLLTFNATGNVLNLPTNPAINTTNGTNIDTNVVNVDGSPTTLLTIAAGNETSSYGGTQPSNLPLAYDVSGQPASSTAPTGVTAPTETWSTTPTSTSNVGIYTDTPSGASQTGSTYTIIYSAGELTIEPAVVTVTGLSAVSRPYNGTTNIALTGTGVLSGLVNGATGTLSGTPTATVPNANVTLSGGVAQAQAVTVSGLSFSLTSGDASDYTFSEPTGLSTVITPATLTVTGNTVVDPKVYDGTNAATVTGGSLSGVIGDDDVTLNQSGTFASPNAGNGIAVTADDTLSGAQAGDYQLAAQPTDLSGDITPATLTIAGDTVVDPKVYDGTDAATLSGGTLAGVVGDDDVTLNQTGTFASPSVANGIAVTATETLGGAQAGNYQLAAQPSELSGDITPATLTIAGTVVDPKVYDGTDAATLTGGTLSGVVGDDDVTLIQTGTFASPNAANGIAVTADDTIGGAQAGDYQLAAQPTDLSGDITPAPVTVVGLSSTNMTYNGTLNDPLAVDPLLGTIELTGLVNNQTLTLLNTGFGTLSNANAGTRSVTANIELANGVGAGAGLASNYTVVQPTLASVVVSPAPLTVTGLTPENATQTYNGSTTVALAGTPMFSGLVSGQTVTVTNLSSAGQALSANAGEEAVTADLVLGNGTGLASNYTVAPYAVGPVDITPATLTISGDTVVDPKVYDGTTVATLSGGSLTGVIGDDNVTLNQSGTFASPNVGNGIAVTATETLGGAQAGNYQLAAQPTELSGDITPATLTIAGTTVVDPKVYDGTDVAMLSGGTLTGVIGDDDVTLNQTGSFASPNVANGIAVNATETLSGAQAGNYQLAAQPTDLSGDITPATLTVTGTTVDNKVYDGTDTATLTGGTLSGVIGEDDVSLTQSGTFASPNAGNGIAVTASDTLGGAQAGNYQLAAQPTDLSGDITPATLTIAGTTVDNKVYDGTDTATLTGGTLSGVIGDDDVSLTQTGSFASPNAGNGIAVTADDTLGGAQAGNYQLAAQPSDLTGDITPATLTIAGTTVVDPKVYDGTDAATLSGGTLTGVIGDDDVTLNQTGTFASPNAANGIAVTATETLGGAQAGNYQLAAQPTDLSGNITPATLTVTGTAVDPKVYDGTTVATLTGGTLTGVIGDDNVTLNQSGTYASPNAGNGIAVTATDSLGGAQAGNYQLAAQPTDLSGDITPATLTIAGTTVVDPKVYDGTDVAMLSGGTLTGVIGDDNVTLNQTGTFASPNAGNGIAVNATETLSGAQAGNYQLAAQPTDLSGNITPATLTIAGTTVVDPKAYDGTDAAMLSGGILTGVVGDDDVTLNQTGTYASPNAGNGIAVTATETLSGPQAGNYQLAAQPTDLSGDITPATLTVTGLTAVTETENGTTTVALTGTPIFSGLVDGQTVTIANLSTAGQVASANPGVQPVEAYLELSDGGNGGQSGNYTVTPFIVGDVTILALSQEPNASEQAGMNSQTNTTVNIIALNPTGATTSAQPVVQLSVIDGGVDEAGISPSVINQAISPYVSFDASVVNDPRHHISSP